MVYEIHSIKGKATKKALLFKAIRKATKFKTSHTLCLQHEAVIFFTFGGYLAANDLTSCGRLYSISLHAPPAKERSFY